MFNLFYNRKITAIDSYPGHTVTNNMKREKLPTSKHGRGNRQGAFLILFCPDRNTGGNSAEYGDCIVLLLNRRCWQ